MPLNIFETLKSQFFPTKAQQFRKIENRLYDKFERQNIRTLDELHSRINEAYAGIYNQRTMVKFFELYHQHKISKARLIFEFIKSDQRGQLIKLENWKWTPDAIIFKKRVVKMIKSVIGGYN